MGVSLVNKRRLCLIVLSMGDWVLKLGGYKQGKGNQNCFVIHIVNLNKIIRLPNLSFSP